MQWCTSPTDVSLTSFPLPVPYPPSCVVLRRRTSSSTRTLRVYSLSRVPTLPFAIPPVLTSTRRICDFHLPALRKNVLRVCINDPDGTHVGPFIKLP